MKLGVISDVHGNLVALETVLYELREEHEVDEVACCGDVVGVLGWPEKTVNRIQEEVDYCVYGNHDAYIRDDYAYVPEHPSQKQEHRVVTSDLTEGSIEWLNNLPAVWEIEDDVFMGHANPYAENAAGYPADEYVNKKDWVSFAADNMDGELVLMGHTHDQGGLDVGKFAEQSGTIVNPGACGAPYFEDARYAIVDTEAHEFSLHRTYFDDTEVFERLNQLGVKPADELNGNPRRL